MAITDTQIDNAIPEYGDTTPHPTQPNQALMNQLLKDVRDEALTAGDLVQVTGQSTTDVMSQKAVSDAFASLGTAATRDAGNSSGQVFLLGPGAHTNIRVSPDHEGNSSLNFGGDAGQLTRLYRIGGATPRFAIYVRPDDEGAYEYTYNFPQRSGIQTVYTTGNTTVDVNGFIKNASPIVKLHSDRIEKNGDFAAEFEKIDTGHYVIKNTLGFAQEGWYIETPKDANGNVKVFVEYEDNDGDITVKTYEPDYSTGRVTAGEPADIPEGRWIDIRLHELLPEAPVEEPEDL